MPGLNVARNSVSDNDLQTIDSDRREVRVHCKLHVQFRYGNINDYGECWNLGAFGMYIAYEGEVRCGDSIEISLVLSDEYPSLIELSGRIVWSNSYTDHSVNDMPSGFGVEFTKISTHSRELIQKLVYGN